MQSMIFHFCNCCSLCFQKIKFVLAVVGSQCLQKVFESLISCVVIQSMSRLANLLSTSKYLVVLPRDILVPSPTNGPCRGFHLDLRIHSSNKCQRFDTSGLTSCMFLSGSQICFPLQNISWCFQRGPSQLFSRAICLPILGLLIHHYIELTLSHVTQKVILC